MFERSQKAYMVTITSNLSNILELEYNALQANTSKFGDRQLLQEQAHKKSKNNGRKKITNYLIIEQK